MEVELDAEGQTAVFRKRLSACRWVGWSAGYRNWEFWKGRGGPSRGRGKGKEEAAKRGGKDVGDRWGPRQKAKNESK